MLSPSNPATKDDFEWYHSEGDDKPLNKTIGLGVSQVARVADASEGLGDGMDPSLSLNDFL